MGSGRLIEIDERSYPPPTKPWLITTLCWLVLKIFYRLQVRGLENLPWDRGAIFAPNHDSFFDPVAVNVVHWHPMNFMARHDLFVDNFFGRAIWSYGAFPVNLERNDPSAFRAAFAALRDGNWLCLFPEGGRSRDGRLGPLREGVARLALKTGVPIVPVRIDGAHEAWPRGRKFPRLFGRITLTYYPPIEPIDIQAAGGREQAVALIMDQLRARISPPGDQPTPMTATESVC